MILIIIHFPYVEYFHVRTNNFVFVNSNIFIMNFLFEFFDGGLFLQSFLPNFLTELFWQMFLDGAFLTGATTIESVGAGIWRTLIPQVAQYVTDTFIFSFFLIPQNMTLIPQLWASNLDETYFPLHACTKESLGLLHSYSRKYDIDLIASSKCQQTESPYKVNPAEFILIIPRLCP